jgi:hypothetical protein
MRKILISLLLIVSFACHTKTNSQDKHPFSATGTQKQVPEKIIKVIKDIPVPDNYQRKTHDSLSFAYYLANLPIKTENNDVYLYNGELKSNQNAQFRVINMDVGNQDLQQCADAVMRLRAEYLYGVKKLEDIHFNFTSGHQANWLDYANGYRAKIAGNSVSWHKQARADHSYSNFREYLNLVFSYAGTFSLSKELKAVYNAADIRIGDVFIQGGFPGHAIIVVDMARHSETDEKIFMLAQSYMPAQEIHVLINPSKEQNDPWYHLPEDGTLLTPEWTFDLNDLKRF